SLINTNFQPISPHHPYASRPVDVLKPTFLIVPKAVEQKLAAQLSASNSPVLTISSQKILMTKKQDIKTQQNSATTTIEQSPTPVHNVEVQTNNESTTKPTMMNTSQKHIGLLATPN
ncbi:unnamed protein product, partial [Rotaria magnacalcarata]